MFVCVLDFERLILGCKMMRKGGQDSLIMDVKSGK